MPCKKEGVIGLFSRFFLIVIAFFTVLVTVPAFGVLSGFAEESPSLTLEQAFVRAIENNPDYKATQAQLGISDAQITTASARLNPSLLSDNGVAERTYRLGFTQILELGGKRKRRIAVAQSQKKIDMADVENRLLALRGEVRRAYTQLYIAQERKKAYEDIVQTTNQLLKVAQQREQAGDIARVDVLGARIAYTNARNDYQTVLYQVFNSRNELSKLLYQPLDNSLRLKPPSQLVGHELMPPSTESKPGQPLQSGITQVTLNLDALIQQALTQRPEIRKNQYTEEAVQQQLALARAKRVPDLRVSAGGDMVTEPDQRKIGVFVITELELPVLNRQQGPIQEALARQEQVRLARESLQNEITFEVISAHTELVANAERMKRYETELLPDAAQVYKLSMISFREGKAPVTTPIQAQFAYVNTRIGYLEALTGYQNAISDLEKAVGIGL